MTESEDERRERRRKVKPPLHFDEEYYCIYCNYCDGLAPSDFLEVTVCGESTRWKESMDSEMDSLVTLVNKTFQEYEGTGCKVGS